MSANKFTERALAKVARLDARHQASLRDRLDARLNERRLILAGLIAQTVRSSYLRIRGSTQPHSGIQPRHHWPSADRRAGARIRRLHTTGVSQCELARRFGVSQPSIFKIVRRQSYRDVA